MRVRPFEGRDLQPLVGLGARMHKESVYAHLDFSAEKCLQIGEWILSFPNKFCGFLADDHSGLIGMFVGFIDEHFFGHDKVAGDLALYVDKSRRGGLAAVRLISAYEEWARTNGAAEISLGISTGITPERTAKLYEACGYVSSGTIFKKRN